MPLVRYQLDQRVLNKYVCREPVIDISGVAQAARPVPDGRGGLLQGWSAEESHADLVAEVRITEPQALNWAEPIRAVVIHQHAGDAPLGSPLNVCQVADPDAQFNGKLVSTLPQERWRSAATGETTAASSSRTARVASNQQTDPLPV